jgi:predicted alpha/beta hydrolase
MTEVQIPTSDGITLSGTLYEGAGNDAIVIAGAMGAPRRYYNAFAMFAAERGYSVLTFDYRGMGESKHKGARLSDWGKLDIAAAIEFMKPRRILLVAQSVGGQVAGLAPNLGDVDGMVFVAVQSGYWKHWSGWGRLRLGFLWMIMPATSRLAGFFPAKLFGLGGENLPRDVAIQWAQWGRDPGYVLGFGHEFDLRGYAAYDGPLLAWSFDDDAFAPRRAVEALLAGYENARVQHRHVVEPGTGHFGFFRRGVGEKYWPETLRWIAEQPAVIRLRDRHKRP